VESINNERFDALIEKEIITREFFLILLTPTALNSEWVKREVTIALKHNKNIIPLYIGDFDPDKHIPNDLAELKRISGIRYIHDYADSALTKIYRILEIKPSIRRNVLYGLASILFVTLLFLILNPSLGIVLSLVPSATGTFVPDPIATATPFSTTVPIFQIPSIIASQEVATVSSHSGDVNTSPTKLNLIRSPDAIAICTDKNINLSSVKLSLPLINETYEIGNLFSESQNTLAGNCWCLQQENARFPLPSGCSKSNSHITPWAGSYWLNSDVKISLGDSTLGICGAQPDNRSTYSCPFTIERN
jgi:hypothetical protein